MSSYHPLPGSPAWIEAVYGTAPDMKERPMNAKRKRKTHQSTASMQRELTLLIVERDNLTRKIEAMERKIRTARVIAAGLGRLKQS